MTLTPNNLTADDARAAFAAGLSVEELDDAAAVAAVSTSSPDTQTRSISRSRPMRSSTKPQECCCVAATRNPQRPPVGYLREPGPLSGLEARARLTVAEPTRRVLAIVSPRRRMSLLTHLTCHLYALKATTVGRPPTRPWARAYSNPSRVVFADGVDAQLREHGDDALNSARAHRACGARSPVWWRP